MKSKKTIQACLDRTEQKHYQHQCHDLEDNFCDTTVIDWYPEEPNNYRNNGESCAHVVVNTSQLNDIPCDMTYGSAAESIQFCFYGLCERKCSLRLDK